MTAPDKLVAIRKHERRMTALIALAIVAAVASFGLAACSSFDSTGSATSAPAGSGDDPPSATHNSSGQSKKKGEPGAEDGVLPDNASPFDTSLPGVAKLDPKLLKAVQDAATAMEQDGIKMHLNTGWRSTEYQEELMKKAIKKYGSKEKAREFVSTPEESHHVTGDAVDVGPTDADDWLNRKGNRFGLCQTLSNEIWHFELVTTPGGTCPPMTNPTDSPG